MKCKQCSAEFDGKFCSECGTKAEVEPPVTQSSPQKQQQVYQQPATAENGKPKKKKKPFFLRWWFILLVIVTVGVILLNTSSDGEKIVWDDIVLKDMLPEPPADKGELHTNAANKLRVDINDLSDKQFYDYINACKEKGFTVEAKSDSYSYNAYNTDGYKISIRQYTSNKEMAIELEAPMEMSAIVWPANIAGKQLPTPKSTIGKFSYEHDDSFFVYVSNTPVSDYKEYVNSCSEIGFNIDYSKGDDYYYAHNTEGWYVSICYEGNNVMSVSISAPDENKNNDTTYSYEDVNSDAAEKESDKNSDSLNTDFKEAMDSYEDFMDEYVAFMKKYKSNPTDFSILADYADYMSKYADFVENFEKWEDAEMTADETAYYIDVQARVSKKLLEAAQ